MSCFWTCGIFSSSRFILYFSHWLHARVRALSLTASLLRVSSKCVRLCAQRQNVAEERTAFFLLCWSFVYVPLCRIEISAICPPVSELVGHQVHFHFRFFRNCSSFFFLSLIFHTDTLTFCWYLRFLQFYVGVPCSLPHRYISRSPFSLKFVVTFVSSSRVRMWLHPSFFWYSHLLSLRRPRIPFLLSFPALFRLASAHFESRFWSCPVRFYLLKRRVIFAPLAVRISTHPEIVSHGRKIPRREVTIKKRNNIALREPFAIVSGSTKGSKNCLAKRYVTI